MMKTFAVWETEYSDEGSVLKTAYTEKGAMRAYRKETGECVSRDDLTPLSTAEMTPEMLEERFILNGGEE
jgi:hypothetical protein